MGEPLRNSNFHRSALVILISCVCPVSASAWPTVFFEPSQDNTLYQTAMDSGRGQNELSNGEGIFLFAGRTGLDGGFRVRRALLQFDLSTLPPGAEILNARLTVFQSRAGPGSPPSNLTIHRVLQPWGEGDSNAAGPEGQGAFAQTGDATWFHSTYNTEVWGSPGGDFVEAASASTTFGTEVGYFVWDCTQGMLDDLNAWIEDPKLNFGWLIIGFEDGAQNARRFHSREHPDLETRPRLRLVYTSPDILVSDGFEPEISCN